MSITEQGRIGEEMAREVLIKMGWTIFQADWLAIKNNNYYVIEVKHKEKFEKPPFDGTGLDQRQNQARLKFQHEHGIRCILLVFEIDKITKKDTGKIYWQFLDILNKSDKPKPHITKNNIILFPLTSYNEGIEGLGEIL